MWGFMKKEEPEQALFERASYGSPGGGSCACGMMTASSAGGGTPWGGASLFDRYGSDASSPMKLLNMQTHTSRLRAQGVRLVCYLNTEVDRGRSVVVHLPEAEDTISEVIPYVQRKMNLDKRMKFAKKLYTPDGSPITSWEHLTSAAAAEIPIIVACGEPFDSTTIPTSMLAFQEHGGGRMAAQQVKHELQERRKKAAQLKADQVRAAGHGTTSSAAKSARVEAVERNRGQAAQMRHEFMENLLLRAAKQEELVTHVRTNNERHRLEREQRSAKLGMMSRERQLDQAEQRKRAQTHSLYEKQNQLQQLAAEKAEKAKEIRSKKKEASALAKEQLLESRKAAGLQRRVSHISRSVQKAEQEDGQLKLRQAQRDNIRIAS